MAVSIPGANESRLVELAPALKLSQLGQDVDRQHGQKFPESAPVPQDASAMFNLGRRYERGDGVAQDYGTAREWMEKAAAKGDADVKAWLGR